MPYLDVTNNLMLTHFDCGSLSLLQLDVTQNIGWLELTIDRFEHARTNCENPIPIKLYRCFSKNFWLVFSENCFGRHSKN